MAKGAFMCVRLSFTDETPPEILYGFAGVGMIETVFEFADRFELKLQNRFKWKKMEFFIRYVDMLEKRKPFQTTWLSAPDS